MEDENGIGILVRRMEWGEERRGEEREVGVMGGENGNRLGCPAYSVCTRKYVQHNRVNHEVWLSWTS